MYLIPPCDTIPSYITSFQSSPVNTWNTVNREMTNVSKLASGVPSGKLNAPPNNCIPSNAKMRMKRNRRKRRERIDLIELSKDITRFRRDDQYFVTLKILNSLSALRTDNPALAFGLKTKRTWEKCKQSGSLDFSFWTEFKYYFGGGNSFFVASFDVNSTQIASL